jgi:hypothetical protein
MEMFTQVFNGRNAVPQSTGEETLDKSFLWVV